MGTLKSCNIDDGNSKMLVSGVPHEEHCHCNSCRFLITVAEKLEETVSVSKMSVPEK